VTGETENYTWAFVGTDTWNGTGNWRNSSGANPSGTPAKSNENTWDPILFDGSNININAGMSVEGWNLRMGLYNGATVTMNNFVKYQGDTTMWMTVDEKSPLYPRATFKHKRPGSTLRNLKVMLVLGPGKPY
jgi:hypothetical protein